MISKGATVAFIPLDMYCQSIFNYVRNQKNTAIHIARVPQNGSEAFFTISLVPAYLWDNFSRRRYAKSFTISGAANLHC